MIRAQKELASRVGKPKRDVQLLQVNQELLDIAYHVAGDRIEQALYTEGKMRARKSDRRFARGSESGDSRKISGGRFVRDLSGIRLCPKEDVSRQHSGKTATRGWPRLSRFASDQLRSRRAAARTRFRDFSTRRNSGTRARDAGSDRRSADD